MRVRPSSSGLHVDQADLYMHEVVIPVRLADYVHTHQVELYAPYFNDNQLIRATVCHVLQ